MESKKKIKTQNKEDEEPSINEIPYLDDDYRTKVKMQNLKLEDTEKEKLAFQKFGNDPEMRPRYKVKII